MKNILKDFNNNQALRKVGVFMNLLSVGVSLILLISVTSCDRSKPEGFDSRIDAVNQDKIQVVATTPNDSKKAIESQASQQVKATAPSSTFQPLYIYADRGSKVNHYIPSGFMPDGSCLNLNDGWSENCQEGKTCMKNIYDLQCSREGQKWAGIYWLNPANNWGQRKGGFNLTGAQKLVFWARGEKGGEQIQEITIGGITGDYPDSDKIVFGPVILTPEWREYTVDLRGKDLSYISGGFAWSTSEDVNAETCVFYLDNIRFE